MSDDNIINLEKYKKERNKCKPIPTLKAFLPDAYYIYPNKGLMIHGLFVTDKSIFFPRGKIYVMEDQFGNLFAEPVDEETCKGWHELHKDVFLYAMYNNLSPDDSDTPA